MHHLFYIDIKKIDVTLIEWINKLINEWMNLRILKNGDATGSHSIYACSNWQVYNCSRLFKLLLWRCLLYLMVYALCIKWLPFWRLFMKMNWILQTIEMICLSNISTSKPVINKQCTRVYKGLYLYGSPIKMTLNMCWQMLKYEIQNISNKAI